MLEKLRHNVPNKVYITETERVKLLTLTGVTDRVVLTVTFGDNAMWLDNTSENRWAFAALAEWRGLNT